MGLLFWGCGWWCLLIVVCWWWCGVVVVGSFNGWVGLGGGSG